MLASGPFLSPWLAFPIAALTMLIIVGHADRLRVAHMPESRRVLRRTNAMLMLVTVPVMAYAAGGASSQRPHEFVLVWTASMVLLVIIILVAILDILNTARLHRVESRELQRSIREARAHLASATLEAARRQRAQADGPPGFDSSD